MRTPTRRRPATPPSWSTSPPRAGRSFATSTRWPAAATTAKSVSATSTSLTKYHVANTLWRIVDRAIQVHGALGYSTDTPLERMMRHARSARLVDGADEVHLQTIARNMIATYKEHGSTKLATGDLL